MTQLADRIHAVLNLEPDKPAVEFQGQWYSWQHLKRHMDDLEGLLAESGIGPGARVGIVLKNSILLVPAILNLLSSDRCLVTLNASQPDSRLSADIVEAAPTVIIARAEDWDRPGLRESAAEIDALTLVAGQSGHAPLNADRAADTTERPVAPGIIIEMLTSGTTGKPKRIPLKQTSFQKMIFDAARFERSRAADDTPKLRSGVQVIAQPFAHISGLLALTNAIVAGRCSCLLEKFSVEGFRDAVTRHRPKVAYAPPAGLRMILESDIDKSDLESLMALRTGAAPLDAELTDEILERFGVPVLQNYGATEFAGGVAGWTLKDFHSNWSDKRGSVGRVNPGIEARIVDPETADLLPLGETGLLELKGKQIGNGSDWVRTTDLSWMDADSFLWIVGRYDNAIIRGGFKILPDDVVSALQQHPAVSEAAVIALPDSRLGQVPAAAYILKAGIEAPQESELQDFLRGTLLAYQVPVRIRDFPDLPRTPTMKVDQRALKEMLIAE